MLSAIYLILSVRLCVCDERAAWINFSRTKLIQNFWLRGEQCRPDTRDVCQIVTNAAIFDCRSTVAASDFVPEHSVYIHKFNETEKM